MILPDMQLTDYPLPEPTCSGKLLIVGTGRCVWDDIAKIPTDFISNCQTMVVNDMGTHYPGRFQHWYSNDNKKLPHWLAGRRDSHKTVHGQDIKFHTNYPGDFGTVWPFHGRGSSGLVACFVGLGLGYDDIILAGIPWDDSGHYYDPPERHKLFSGRKATNFTNETKDQYITEALKYFGGKIKSMSGRSKVLLNASP